MINKNHVFLFSIITVFISVSGCSKKENVSESRSKEVIVYTYDSFAGEWGPGGEIARLFNEKTGLTATFVDCGDGVQVLSRAILEKDNVQADVILGIDNNDSRKALSEGILESYKPQNAEELIPEELRASLCDGWELVPYDYSPFAMIFDTQSNVAEPASLDDLTNPEYAKKIILMDPRTSTPGLGFVSWTKAVKGEAVLDYWRALKPNILTMAPGWSSGYGLFTNGEAPLVISYTTSAAYHVEYDNTDRYKALIFDEGHVMQVEGAGVLKNAPNKAGAQAFMDFLISEEAQDALPLTQWMYPANKNVTLPESYQKGSPIPTKILDSPKTVEEESALQKTVSEIMSLLAE